MTIKLRKQNMILVTIILVIIFFVGKKVSAFDLSNEWEHQNVKPTWDENITDPGMIEAYIKYEKTGMAFNQNFYATAGKNGWPLGAQMYLEERPGKANMDFSNFNLRHTYCTGNHTIASPIQPGARAFKSGEYYYSVDQGSLFKEAKRGENLKFNFLMLAIACYYPGDYKINANAMSTAEDPAVAQGLVMQAIAWMATNDKSEGFSGDWNTDYKTFRNYYGYYDKIMNGFTQAEEPAIYHALRVPINPDCDALKPPWNIENKAIDGYFWDVWQSAYLTAQLEADWDKDISTFNIAIKEADGEYQADVSLFVSEQAKMYLKDIKFQTTGDWETTGTTEDGIMHFKSPTGELDENGSIGYLEWDEGHLGYFMPIDQTKAKIVTFDTWNVLAGNGGAFGCTQTQFTSYVEKGLKIYLTIADGPGEKVEVERFKHTERWETNYNVNLYKFDSETGKPIEGSHWDILEKFDDTQLDDTDLDRESENPGSYDSGLGTLNSTSWGDDDISSNYSGDMGVNSSDTNKYNWGNDSGTQFRTWADENLDPCTRDDNVTGADGKLYEVDSAGENSGTTAHTDDYTYTYFKGYCSGHPAPTIEYVECTHDKEGAEPEECDCEEINQEVHDEAWKKWYGGVETCEKLVEEGGFFHCVEPGDAAKTAMEEDRDQFYKEFISLNYEYSAKEIEAAKGYILHGTHMDDIPIEWRIVTSSEYKDTDEATDISHSGSSGGSTKASANEMDVSGVEGVKAHPLDTTKEDVAAISEREDIISFGVSSNAGTLGEKLKLSSISYEPDRVDPDEFEITDIEIFEDGTITNHASPSDATPSNARPETRKTSTGFRKDKVNTDSDADKGMYREKAKPGGTKNTVKLELSKADMVVPPLGDLIDWTFIAYDHRTEGEVHFNKTDFNLINDESAAFNAYGQENADGSLEGAVYGLFASEDILHPDSTGKDASKNDTGIVFKKGDLVAVATTDRNGDASFMSITEAPGSVYNYETGKIEHSEWYRDAPVNLHRAEDDSAASENDIESFIGFNPDHSEITAGNGGDLADTAAGDDIHTAEYFYKLSSNQLYDDTYREAATTGRYPISNNEENNGNCWIGRPLFVGPKGTSYYIKELSRSEGYEMSVYGKDDALMSNRKAFEDGEVTSSTGTVSTKPIAEDRVNGGVTYSISSNGTDNGYLVYLTDIPEGATVNVSASQFVWDDNVSHYETEVTYVPVMAQEGAMVMLDGHTWKASLGDRITYNGKSYQVSRVQTIKYDKQNVKPDNAEVILNPYLDASTITESGNLTKDINLLFNKNGFRTPFEGSPWTVIEVDSLTVGDVAKAINEKVFTDDWYHAFNAMSMRGSYSQAGHLYAVISYSYRYAANSNAIYNADNDSVYVKTKAEYTAMPSGTEGFIYRVYRAGDCEDVKRNATGFVESATVPNQTSSGTATYENGNPYDTIRFVTRQNETYWAYAAGEQLLNLDGSYAYSEEKKLVEKTPTLVERVTDTEMTPVNYTENGEDAAGTKYGTYSYAVTQEFLDSLAGGEIKFRLMFQGNTYEKSVKELYAIKHGHVSATLPLKLTGSFMEEVVLTYPGQNVIHQDGGKIFKLQERPIRQKVKVSKDIQTLENPKVVWYCLNCGFETQDGIIVCGFCGTGRTVEETKTIRYAHDTYSAVHAENISADRTGGLYDRTTDWLTSLLRGDEPTDSAADIPNFRFKAYLKSNLERLYRDVNGEIIWTDRNGNTMTPQYKDTNGDGNYDTFTWKYDAAYAGIETDFPEKDIVSADGKLESSNVQKIYTRVLHNTDSKTSSAQANNVWDDYDSPQVAGNTENVGEKEGFSTSLREKQGGVTGDLSGKAVDTSAALYSYSGKNTDVAVSDKIKETQNTGYTRLLETRKTIVEDGDATREAELYNYEKFFDAIQTANTDIWDDDMHSSFTGSAMNNYPGQRWFDTFYESYQKDDADPDHTIANTDGADADGTAGGDRDTSFKPFRWIRENVFGDYTDYEKNPAEQNGVNTETVMSTSHFAKANAEASDAVREFATKWYLEDEAGKLLTNNGMGEDIGKADGGILGYDEAIHDEALFHAIAKTYNYLKPFYQYDLDTIYSVEWDSEAAGDADADYTTLSIDNDGGEEYYSISSYLPYGTYVVVEQRPGRVDEVVNDFRNRSYTIEKPKELMVPTVYDGPESNHTTDNYDPHYIFSDNLTLQEQAKKDNYLIRFGEDWPHNNVQDEREFVIRAHGWNGDVEIYKYGLDIDKLTGKIAYGGDEYTYAGFKVSQDEYDPLKDYYDTKHREKLSTEDGGDDNSHYHASDKTNKKATANGETYDGDALARRFFYASITEDAGIADNVLFGNAKWGDNVRAVTGELTAYEGGYASMLVPWTMTAPADMDQYSGKDFSGYADTNMRDGFFTTKLKINKVDSETGEYILHDNAIFALYAGSRYTSYDEIKRDAGLIGDAGERQRFLKQFKPGDAKLYLKDTTITGTKEFLEAMRATDITKAGRERTVIETAAGVGEMYTGMVKKGTPICMEGERIMLNDEEGGRTGQMTVYTTLNDIEAAGEENVADKEYVNQNTGYFVTPQPIGAGVYVLAELKPPAGYVRSAPVAYEVYSDKTQYYVDGDMYSKVTAVRSK